MSYMRVYYYENELEEVWIVQEGDFCTSFTFAARNNKPVLPVFITMSDSDVIDADGFYV